MGARRRGPEPDLTFVANDIGSVGGMERQLTDLIVGLRRLGHRVRVVARTCDLPPGTDVEFHRVRGPGRPFVLAHPWFLLAGTIALWRHRRGIVQVNGAIVLNRVDVVAVHYLHQVGPATSSRGTLLFRAHIRLAALLKRWSEPLAYRRNRAQRFVCVSEGVADELRENLPWLAERVQTIHNGIDTDAFAPGTRATRPPPRGRPWSCRGAGSPSRSSGASGSARASSPRSARSHPRRTGRCWSPAGRPRALSGARGPRLAVADRRALARRQLRRAARLPARRRVRAPVELRDLLARDVRGGRKRLPVLVTPVSGVRELIVDGDDGFLIRRDPELIAQRLNELAADPALRARLGSAARRRGAVLLGADGRALPRAVRGDRGRRAGLGSCVARLSQRSRERS